MCIPPKNRVAASLLTGCPQQQGGPDASPSSSSSSRPHHTDSSDDSSSDDTSSSSSSSEPEIEIPEGGYTIDKTTGTYHVYTAEGLQAWADAAQSTPPGQDCSTNCTLEKDIVLTDEWTPISFYVGTFDGQGHTISGLQVTQSDFATNGMFRMIKEGGCVKNLRLENPMVTGTKSNTSNGAIVGQLGRGGQIIGCTVSDATISGSLAGGIAGSTSGGGGNSGEIIGCMVTDSTIEGTTTGGIVGSVQVNTTITACCFVGSDASLKGGIVGAIQNPGKDKLTAEACYWSGGAAQGVSGSGTYDGVAKVDGTWNTAVEAMNKALEGTKCTYRYGITGSTPTLGPDSGAKALARLFNLTWPL